MKITQINLYPVKSLRGISLERAVLGQRGISYDRNWMVVNDTGRFVTQRQLPHMAQVEVKLDDERLILEHPHADPLTIELARNDQARMTAHVWDDHCTALDEGADASRWLGSVMGGWRGSDLRLVRFAPEQRRPVEPYYQQGEQAHTAFADGYPFLVASESSLAALNEVLQCKGGDAIPMNRFRPNVVFEGAEAFAEDEWQELLSTEGRYRLGLRKPCQRCKITTVDQRTGNIASPGEPLQTLVEMKTRPGLKGAYFGQNATLLSGEGLTIQVGDALKHSR
ncbi:MOSC domain-containing protein [Billgrantia endophytica]|uniref:MOSC domain-containing protein n=1 Tax=Billgrantia endophytica TaxID=2033802 RepID=A0A2N7U539_9GAMM|nr:MOSC N-terminal beta barrel domain-containing protein [Halomonas endophytica]PMR75549.1 MOSC domain-containing protein [Halomonas endophytica]